MSETETPTKGKVVIAPEALMTIARLAALSVPGVVRMANVPGGVNWLFQRRPIGKGVHLEVRDHTVRADLHLVVAPGANMRNIGLQVQAEVTRAMEQMVGMDVDSVNVHIDDVAFPAAPGE